MRELQAEILSRNIERLSEILIRAERRCARYNAPCKQRDIDLAFVEHLAVALHQLKKFEREHSFNEDRESLMACLKDAVAQLNELGEYARTEMEGIENFQKRLIEREERWVRMLNVSMVALFVNICADNIRYALEEIDRNVRGLDEFNRDKQTGKNRPQLYIVK